MRASRPRGVVSALLRPALWFSAWNLLAAALAAQCTNPTQVPNQTISSGTWNFSDNNALAASNVVISGSASVTFVAGNCIHLQPGFRATAGTAGTTFHAWVETAPSAVSVSPSGSSGLSQQFTFTGSSPSGYGNLSEIYGLFNTSVSGVNACYIRYNRASNLLYLANNSGGSWLGGFVPGSGGSASNSQCSINGNGSSFSAVGNQLSVTVAVTFQTAFSGAKNEYLNVYDNEGLNSTWQPMGTWTVPAVQQYYLTTAVSPTGGGTITPASGWYNSGAVVWVSANANQGYQFSGLSGALTGTTTPQQLTMNGNKSVTANFVPVQALTIPAPLKGFTYFPRGHAWWDMLYHWYSQDCDTSTLESCVSGHTVADVVADDLQMLSQNGSNFIHLYLWDQDIAVDATQGDQLPVGPDFQGVGFRSWDNGGPENSPNNQWGALGAFVELAKNNDIWVMVHMAASRPTKLIDITPSSAAAVGTAYGNWFAEFIDYLAGHENVLIWAPDYNLQQPVASPSPFWHAAYPVIASSIQQHAYSNPPGRALLAVQTPFGFYLHEMEPRPAGGYQFNWQRPQETWYNWGPLAAEVGSFPPDLIVLGAWHAHAGDLQGNLKCVAGFSNDMCQPATCQNCTPVPYAKMFISEFGAGTSLEPPPVGNGAAFWGDALEPTTSETGQRDWVRETLCVLKRLNINKYSYHGLYDSKSFWDAEFDLPATELTWRGFWGLKSEDPEYDGTGDKLSWPAWRDFNWNDPNSCPNVPATPVVALFADAPYYTVNDTGKITYTAANVTSLDLNEPSPPEEDYRSYSCDPNHPDDELLPPDQLVGSCAFTNIKAIATGTITLTGENTSVDGHDGSGLSAQAATSVTVGLAPIVHAVVNFTTGQTCDLQLNPSCVISASQRDVLTIWGMGFNPSGQNLVQLEGQSTSEWLYETDGYYFWDQSRTQINAEIGCFVLPGSYALKVWSPNSGTPSNGATISISAGGNCP